MTADRVPRTLEAANTFMALANWNLTQRHWKTAAARFNLMAHVLTSVDMNDSDRVSHDLLPTLTARQNILLPLDLAGRSVDGDRLRQVCASLGLTDRLQHRPSELSGGQQQRVAIARALITEPAVIFADEPTGALDSTNGQALLSQLRTASRELGQTIVMVTHDAGAAAYADRALLINDGRVVGDLDHPDAESIRIELSQVGV
jgi:putative ABC transport system ATP-binding protein